MGGGGTLVDGIRRFFNRRNSINSQSLHHHNNNNNNDFLSNNLDNANNNPSSLNLLKVPKRFHFKSSSMDRNKKVAFLILVSMKIHTFGFQCEIIN